MPIVIALDAGTTSVRAVAVNDRGEVVGHRSREITQYFPHPGWVEHDAQEIFATTCAVTAELIASLDEEPVAFGITNQRETVVAWDRTTGKPLAPAIVWQDRRGAGRCDELRPGSLDLVRSTTGLVLDPYFSATKLEWLFNEGGIPADEHTAVGTIGSSPVVPSMRPNRRMPREPCCSISRPWTGPPSCVPSSGCHAMCSVRFVHHRVDSA